MRRPIPGKINMTSSGNGNLAAHLAGELFGMMAGIDMVHVALSGHRRGTYRPDHRRCAGDVRRCVGAAIEVQSGKLRALAVTVRHALAGAARHSGCGRVCAGLRGSGWQGIGAPRNTPAEIVDRLNKEINACLAISQIKARIADLGYAVFASSPAEFVQLMPTRPKSGLK